MLSERKFDSLDQLADKKMELSDLLDKSSKQRVSLLKIDINKPASQALKEFVANCSEEDTKRIIKLNKELAETLNTCRERNSINGQVITNNYQATKTTVTILSGGDPTKV